MTKEELAKLTPEEKRIAIAEACGAIWVRLIDQTPHRSLVMPDDDFGALARADTTEAIVQIHSLPDYLNDLNAIHEAEKAISPDQLEWMQEHLRRVVHKDTTDANWAEGVGPTAETKMWHATAVQRADAFLLTV